MLQGRLGRRSITPPGPGLARGVAVPIRKYCEATTAGADGVVVHRLRLQARAYRLKVVTHLGAEPVF